MSESNPSRSNPSRSNPSKEVEGRKASPVESTGEMIIGDLEEVGSGTMITSAIGETLAVFGSIITLGEESMQVRGKEKET